MFCDTSNMDEHQKAYMLAKRAQFAKAASASVGDTASVGDATSAWVKVQVLSGTLNGSQFSFFLS